MIQTAVCARLLLLMGIAATGAFGSLITYDINFTATTGVVPASGSFNYDIADDPADPFSDFTVTWMGYVFDETNSANGLAALDAGCGASAEGESGGAAAFTILTNCPAAIWTGYLQFGLSGPSFFGIGLDPENYPTADTMAYVNNGNKLLDSHKLQ